MSDSKSTQSGTGSGTKAAQGNDKTTGSGSGQSATNAAQQRAAEFLRQASAAFDDGKLEEAKDLCDRIIQENPESIEAGQAKDLKAKIRAQDEPGTITLILFVIAGLGFWFFIISGGAALFNAWNARAFWSNNWLGIIVAVAAFGLLTWAVNMAEKHYPQMSENTKNFVLVFGAIPLIIIALGSITFLSPTMQKFVIESTFITVVCILPAATYYLFLRSRRLGILNEFIGNLAHFSLYERRLIYDPDKKQEADGKPKQAPRHESKRERQLRIEGYLQRFEAMYGQLRFDDGRNLRSFTTTLIEASQPEQSPERDKASGTGDGGIFMPENVVRIADIFQANLVIPIGLVTILSGVGWMLSIHPAWSPVAGGTSNPEDFRLTLELTPVNFAFFGAYFFGIQMLFRRFVIRDLSPNAFMAFAVRIVLAVIAAWVAALCLQILGSFGSENNAYTKISANLANSSGQYEWPAFLLVLAFVIGFFPQVLWQVIKAMFTKSKLLSIAVPETDQDQPLSQLDGLTIWHAARLEEEDVENVGNMATVDIVDIMLRTQIPAERLVSWIDQAILYSVLGKKHAKGKGGESTVDKLRALGIRNASQFIANYNDLAKQGKALNETFGGDENKTNPIHTIACSIEKEANFHLIRAWRGV
ncbi:hypothetical protein [Hoeflea sp.]|uniref:hypothetical protein n=1 Tax=Hoeflea sp. TaxID=1940281 RepID=UPI003B028586